MLHSTLFQALLDLTKPFFLNLNGTLELANACFAWLSTSFIPSLKVLAWMTNPQLKGQQVEVASKTLQHVKLVSISVYSADANISDSSITHHEDLEDSQVELEG